MEQTAKAMDAQERWKPVVGFEGLYEVSDLGRVRSLARVVAFGNRERVSPGKILSPNIQGCGYGAVNLFDRNRRTVRCVHRLVALAFLGNPEGDRIEVNHKNARKEDNRLCNLEWCTRRENVDHAMSMGLTANSRPPVLCGERNPATKLTDKEAAALIEARRVGRTFQQLASDFRISPAQAFRIVNGSRRNLEVRQ